MRKTFKKILTTSLVLVGILLVQQLSVKGGGAKKATAPLITPSIFNNTDFTASVTLHYGADLRPDKTYSIPPRSTVVCEKKNLLLYTIKATFGTTGNKYVYAVDNFSAPAGTVYNDFQIDQDGDEPNKTAYKCIVWRVSDNGNLINKAKPGFTFINATAIPATPAYIEVSQGLFVTTGGGFLPQNQSFSGDYDSKWHQLWATTFVDPNYRPGQKREEDYKRLVDWGKEMAVNNLKNSAELSIQVGDDATTRKPLGQLSQTEIISLGNQNRWSDYLLVIWGNQYSGPPQIFATSSSKPTYKVTDGVYYNKTINAIILRKLSFTKANDVGTGKTGDKQIGAPPVW